MSQFTDKRTKGYHWEDCANKDNAQFLAIAKVPILVARYAGSPILLEKVEDAVRMYQVRFHAFNNGRFFHKDDYCQESGDFHIFINI